MFFRLFFDFLFQCLPDCILYAVELLQKTVPFFDAEFLIADKKPDVNPDFSDIPEEIFRILF